MIQLQNRPYKEYITLDFESLDIYLGALRLGKFPEVDHFGVKDIFSAPWGFVKDMQELICISGITYEKFMDIYADYNFVKKPDAYNTGIFHLQECIVWTIKQIEQVCTVEKARLTQGHITNAELQAGIEDLKIFRTFPQTDSLAKGNPLKYPKVRHKLIYRDAFLKLSYDTSLRAYHKRLYEILHPPK